MLRVNSARAGSCAWWTAGTSATMIAIAPVAWTDMKTELVDRASGDSAEEVAVEPCHRVDTGQQCGGQAIGDALHAEDHAGDRVVSEALASEGTAKVHVGQMVPRRPREGTHPDG